MYKIINREQEKPEMRDNYTALLLHPYRLIDLNGKIILWLFVTEPLLYLVLEGAADWVSFSSCISLESSNKFR